MQYIVSLKPQKTRYSSRKSIIRFFNPDAVGKYSSVHFSLFTLIFSFTVDRKYEFSL